MSSNEEVLRNLIRDVETLKAEQKRLASIQSLFWVGNHDPTQRSITASQNNYEPGNYDSLLLYATGAFNITGVAGGVLGRILYITVFGSNSITFTHQDAASIITNRMLMIGAASVTKGVRATLMLMYVAHDSGNKWVQIV